MLELHSISNKNRSLCVALLLVIRMMLEYITEGLRTLAALITQLPFQILLTPPDEGPRVKGSRIKLQDIVDGHYTPMRVNGTWISRKCFALYSVYISMM